MKKMKVVNVIMILLPLVIGGISALLTKSAMIDYGNLNKPFLSPPSYIFPIAWTILYMLMGIAAAIVYSSNSSEYRSIGLALHFIQLVLNFFWSIIFFNMQKYLFAFIWLVLLLLTVFFMNMYYGKVNHVAKLLNTPYLFWLIFAGYLNFSVYLLN